MRSLNRGCIALLLVSGFAATAQADDPPAAPAAGEAAAAPVAPMDAPAPPPPPAPRKFAGARTSYYMSGSVADSPSWTIGTTRAPGFSLAVGLNLSYDSQGLVEGTMRNPDHKVAFRGLVYGSYYIYNRFPIGIATEVALATGLTPTAFDVFTVQPGLVMYYAPFPVPLVIGTALDLQINFIKDGPTQIKTLTPGLRLVYVFP